MSYLKRTASALLLLALLALTPASLTAQTLTDPKPLDLYHLALGVVEVGQPGLSQVSDPDMYYLGMTLLSKNGNYKASVKDPDVKLVIECFLAGQQLYSIDKFRTAMWWAVSQVLVGSDEPKFVDPPYQRHFVDALRLRDKPAEAKKHIEALKP